MKSLAICIPTYKRPEMLERCVRSAVSSAGGRPISIFIADDSETDINTGTLTRLRSEFPFIRTCQNPRNLGIDRNIQKVVDMNDCEFAWLIGEDDLFLPDAIAGVHDLLQNVSVPFLFSNYQYVTEGHDVVIGTALPDSRDAYVEPSSFISGSLWATGFIGGCIVRTRDWLATQAEPYDGTYFTHVGRILDMLARDTHMYVRASPAVANRAQGDDTFTWKKDSFGVFLGFERMCEVAAHRNPGLDHSIALASRTYRNKFAYFSMKTALRLRSQGAFDWRQYRTYVSGSNISAARKAWFMLMAAIPPLALQPVVWAHNLRSTHQPKSAEKLDTSS